MPTKEALRERAIILIVSGLVILGLGFGALFNSVGFSSGPLNSGPPEYIAPVVLFIAGVVFLSAGVFLRRQRIE